MARANGLNNVEIRECHGASIANLGFGSFDALISRVGLLYLPHLHQARVDMRQVVKESG